MNGLWQDLRFSARMARRKPLVSVVSVVSLTVGIALTAVVFTLINAALIRPMAVTAPGGLAWISEQRQNSVNYTLPWPDYVDIKAAQQVFTDMAASGSTQFSLRADGRQLVTVGELVSGSYFPMLGPRIRAGRPLAEADHQSAAAVAVVSERLWRELAPEARTFAPLQLLINEHPFAIVGVVDDRFAGVMAGRRTDMWVPVVHVSTLSNAPGPNRLVERRMSWLTWIARLKAGVTLDAAAADLNRVEAGLAPTVGRTEPKVFRVTDGSRGATMGTAGLEPTLRVLLAAALVVLLVACANVANLLLARGAERRRELAVRTALGASTLRVIRLFMLEAGLIAVISTVAALGLAAIGARLAAPLLVAFGSPIALDLSLDWRTTGFLAALALVATMVAGLVPAVGTVFTRGSAIDEATRAATAGRLAMRTRHGLLVLQFGCSVALIVAAVLLFRTLANLRGMPTGFDTDRVVLLTVAPRGAGLPLPETRAYVADMLRRLRETAGVEAASYARIMPVGFIGSRGSLVIPGVTAEGQETDEINFNEVSAGYFEAMGIPVVAGRAFTDAETLSGRAIIVNEAMAKTFWPQGAVGRTILWEPDQPPVEIVGVAKDAKYRSLREATMPSFYIPMGMGRPGDGTFHVRVDSAPDARLEDLRRVLTSAYPNVAVTTTRTLRAQAELNLADDRIALSIGLSLAVAALLLAAAGLFGSMSYYVTQRTREFGVRVALGADARHVSVLVIRQGLRLAVAGTVLGLVATIWTTRVIESRLFGVTTLDPASLALGAAVLTGVALVATLVPARRAARTDPMAALRDE